MSANSFFQQNAAFVSNKILARLPFISRIKIDLDGNDSEQRALVEAYIYKKFSERYGANVQHFLPYLLVLRCNDNICAAVGIRAAESGPLYIEKYLRYPIEQEIGVHFKTAIQRNNIVEIGNLVMTWRGSSQLLFLLLTDLLSRINREWVVFTATKEVEHLLNKMNFTLIHIADAPGEKLGVETNQWGSYCQDKPRVMFCYIPSAMSILKQNTLMNSSLSLFSNRLAELADQWKARNEQ